MPYELAETDKEDFHGRRHDMPYWPGLTFPFLVRLITIMTLYSLQHFFWQPGFLHTRIMYMCETCAIGKIIIMIIRKFSSIRSVCSQKKLKEFLFFYITTGIAVAFDDKQVGRWLKWNGTFFLIDPLIFHCIPSTQ